MTLILGANLSDRVYIAADSRVTITTENESLQHDHVLKMLPLIKDKRWGGLNVAVAGHLDFVCYLCKRIGETLKSGDMPHEVIDFQEEIKTHCAKFAGEWLEKGNEYKKAVLLFGGVSYEGQKTATKDQVEKLVESYEDNSYTKNWSPEELKDLIKNDPNWKKFNEKMGGNAFELMEKSRKAKIPPRFQALYEGKSEVVLPATFLFSVSIELPAEPVVNQVSWGHFLAYGTNKITNKNIPKDLLAKLELVPNPTNNQPDLMQSALIKATILDTAKNLGIKEIGGNVFIWVISQTSNRILHNTKEVNRDNSGKLWKNGDVLTPIENFYKYYDGQDNGINAEL